MDAPDMDSIGQRSRGERFSRLAGSWIGLTAVFCLGFVGFAAAAATFDVRLHRHALAEARVQGHLIADLVTHGELTGADLAAGLPLPAQQRMRSQVASLQARGDVLGFQLWTASGSPLFLGPAPGSTSPDELRRHGRGLVMADGRTGTPSPDDVLVPLDLEGDSQNDDVDVVAVVLLPRNGTDELRATAKARLGWVGAALGLILAAALMLARRRQLHRDHAARHDQLTGLGNRILLAEAVHVRSRDAYALLLLDLDGFKDVNDTLGHAAGDELLVQVAAALPLGARDGDLVFRLSGDEFVLLLDGIADPELAMQVAGDVLGNLARTGFSVRGIDLDVRASVGVTINGPASAGGSALLRQADVAMYRAKQRGAAAVLYSKDLDRHDTDRLALLGDLRRAIAADELTLRYQPIVAVSAAQGWPDPSAFSVEALVRWQHPVRGLLLPEAFVPVAEHTGVIHSLTAWVLDRALSQAATWRRSGLDPTVSVNLSPSAVTRALVGLVTSTLHRHDMPAARLKLEITETAVAGEATATIAILSELRATGVQISLDCFGAGYSSPAHLAALPLTEVKIDRGFFEAVTGHSDTSPVVAALIEQGHRLGLAVVAVGVETDAHGRELAALGCDSIQGFLHSRPLHPEQVAAWVEARGSAAGGAEPLRDPALEGS